MSWKPNQYVIDFDQQVEIENHVRSFIVDLLNRGFAAEEGRLRIAMIAPSKRYVIKVPISFDGLLANERERAYFMHDLRQAPYAFPMASCRLFYANEEIGVSMLMMRFVRSYERGTKLPSWVDFIDGSQVGYDHRQRLVAFDP